MRRFLTFFVLTLTISTVLFSSTFAQDRSSVRALPLQNSFAKTPSDPQLLTVSVISTDQAEELFRRFANDPAIPFGYPFNGCHTRATQMSRIADAEGIVTARIYIHGNLKVKLNNPTYPRANWLWHVAPVLYVASSNHSAPELMVFDPSIASHPMTVPDFEKLLAQDFKEDGWRDRARVKFHYFGSRFQYMEDWRSEPNKLSWSNEDLADVEKAAKYYLWLQTHPEDIDRNSDEYKINSKWIGKTKHLE